VLEQSAGLGMSTIPFLLGGPKLLSHLVQSDVNDLIDIQHRYAPPQICQAALDAIVNLLSSPHVTVLELFENIDPPDPLRRVDFPATPVAIIVEIVLPEANPKNSIPGYGPGKFVLEGGHFVSAHASGFQSANSTYNG